MVDYVEFLFWNVGLEKVVPLSPVLVNIYCAPVMMDFRPRRKEAAAAGDKVRVLLGSLRLMQVFSPPGS